MFKQQRVFIRNNLDVQRLLDVFAHKEREPGFANCQMSVVVIDGHFTFFESDAHLDKLVCFCRCCYFFLFISL